MCNLYTVRKSIQEVASHFGVKVPNDLPNITDEIYPGSPGLVARETKGNLVLQAMTWGRPHRPKGMKETSKPIAVNNVADVDGYFWRKLAADPANRCLAPMTGFAEADGPKGARTRTWVTIDGREIADWGALCGPSDQWGNWYSGMMTNANDDMAWLHNRMPVFILPDHGGSALFPEQGVSGGAAQVRPDAGAVDKEAVEGGRRTGASEGDGEGLAARLAARKLMPLLPVGSRRVLVGNLDESPRQVSKHVRSAVTPDHCGTVGQKGQDEVGHILSREAMSKDIISDSNGLFDQV